MKQGVHQWKQGFPLGATSVLTLPETQVCPARWAQDRYQDLEADMAQSAKIVDMIETLLDLKGYAGLVSLAG